MKSKVLIIEDNYNKFFTTKLVLESQLKMKVDVVGVETSVALVNAATELKPDLVVCCPKGGVVELLDRLKKRGTNRRNTEIVILVTHEVDDELASAVLKLTVARQRRMAQAA